MKSRLQFVLCLALLSSAGPAFAMCGPPHETNAFGRAIDAQDPTEQKNIETVVRRHFTPDVQRLVRGNTTTNPADDIAYTLRQIPNHYGALRSMSEWQLKYPLNKRPGRYLSIDCYFERAIDFRPGDANLYVLYAIYLHRAGRFEDARVNYVKAQNAKLNSPEFYYNWGLTEFALRNYDEAARLAGLAYAGGYPLPGLKNKLAEVGRSVVLPEQQ